MELPGRESIDPDATKVVKRLNDAGYQAYLVGGCVRDLLLDRSPKDYDVATDATPQQIKRVFPSCRIIGRRFRLAHVRVGSKIIETATFRANPRKEEGFSDSNELLIKHDNVFGSETEDAQRRDFTVNGLFYDVAANKVIDYVDGLADIEARLIRTIGEPNVRFKEDPVRMLRAIKFASRLDFNIENDTRDALIENRWEIHKSATARILEEVIRMLRSRHAAAAFKIMVDTDMITAISPRLASLFAMPTAEEDELPPGLDDEEKQWHRTWQDDRMKRPGLNLSFCGNDDVATHQQEMMGVLEALDTECGRTNGQAIGNSALLATLMMPYLRDVLASKNMRATEVTSAISELAEPILQDLRCPRRDAERLRQILVAQRKLISGRKNSVNVLSKRDYFSDAIRVHRIDCLATGKESEIVADFEALDQQSEHSNKRRRRRRGGRRRRRTEIAHSEA